MRARLHIVGVVAIGLVVTGAAAPVSEPVPRRAPALEPTSHAPRRWFDGRAIRPADRVTMVVTAYSPDERSCGRFADGITASGFSVWTNGMRLVAADTSVLPFGTLVSIPGYHDADVVPVLDRGGRIKGRRLDVLFPTHELAIRWGVRKLDVTVWEYVDERRDAETAGLPRRDAESDG